MAVVLTYAASVPVVKLGRIAGQYAKPRSSDLETRDGVTLPAYRGDAVNGFDFTAESRVPDPQRLRRGLPLLGRDAEPRARLRHRRLRRPAPGAHLEHRLRARLAGRPALRAAGRRDRPGADLHAGDRRRPRRVPPGRLPLQPRGADPGVRARADPDRLAHRARRTTSPATSSGSGSAPASSTAPTSSCSSHIRNPIGVKLGPTTTPDDAIALAEKLNPDNEPGRLTFITRMGAGKIRDALPPLVEKVTAAGVDGRLGLRPDARQHLRGVLGLQDPPLRRRDRRGAGLLRRAPRARHLARRRARRAHRRRRHRVRRRRRGARSRATSATATSRSATRG